MERLTKIWMPMKYWHFNSHSPNSRTPHGTVQPSPALAQESQSSSKSIVGPEVFGAGEDQAVADLIFVHGLGGDKIQSWSKGTDGICWPRDILSKDMKQIRIITWGYDSSVVKAFAGSSQASIFGHAENLLADIASPTLRFQSRPIIFVGHSLGGIVIKQALIRSAEYSHNLQHRDLGSVYEHTLGVIFLGTPHRGSSQANIGRIISNIIRITGKRSNSKVLQALEKDSAVLEDQRGSFASISNKMYIVCAYEELPMSVGGIVVPEESAVFEGFNVKRISVPADHSNMCKFSDSQDIGYRRILDQIITCLRNVNSHQASFEGTQSLLPESVLAPPDNPRPTMAVSRYASRSPDIHDFDDSRSRNGQASVVDPHEDPPGPSSETTTLIDASRSLYTQDFDTSTSPDVAQSPQDPGSQSVDDRQHPYHMLFQFVNESRDQFRVIDKALRSPTVDKWTNLSDMDLKLSMTSGGRSGSILLKNDTVPELFSVTAGIHSSLEPWCDILIDLPDEANADGINRLYYQSRLERSQDACKRTFKGTSISIASFDLSGDGTYVAKATIRKETPVASLVKNRGPSGRINCGEPNTRISEKVQELLSKLKPNDVTMIFIRAEGSKALLQFTNKLIDKVHEKALQGDTNLKEMAFPRFRGAAQRVYEYIRNTSKQHRVLQFFTEDEIRNQLHEHHVHLGTSYTSLTKESYSDDEQASEAEGGDRTSIDECMINIGGDVTKIVGVLDCDNPPKDVMSTLKRLGVQVGRKDVGPTTLLRDFIKWIDRDWFWLTFTSQSRQEIKAPLTQVVKDIIPFIEHAIANDDKIALTSNELTTLQMVDRLFSILDNSKNSALVKSLRSALAETSLRDRLREVDVDF